MTDQRLAHIVIRVPKEHSSFTYFTLEAHDGMCFYSTLPHEVGQIYRDIDIKATLPFRAPLEHTLSKLQEAFDLTILQNSII